MTWSATLRPDRLAIFLFHGVIPRPREGVRNYTRKHLPVGEFRLVLEGLRRAGTPVGPDAILAGAPLPRCAFLVTFDDGFRNNLTVALPELERLEIPAVVYVTTGFVEENAASWIDRVEDAVERTTARCVRLPWEARARPTVSVAERRTLLDAVRATVKARADLDPDAVAHAIAREAGVPRFSEDPQLDAKLTWSQVRTLDAHPLCTIGGHSRTHRILSFLPREELREELDESIGALERNLGHEVVHYSYPEGLAHCYSDAVVDELRARGIRMCPTAEPGLNRPGDDLFRLKRIAVA